jgi:phosphoribosylformimino-5-aminoimidazole carboxamide ribotide isomerase
MRIIPALDIIDNKCVRLTKGDYSAISFYSDDPLYMAKKFEDCGCKYIHLVDLDGARSSHLVNIKILEQIASKTQLTIDFGGGIKTNADIHTAFECGASQVTIGSVAVTDKELFLEWLKIYGSNKIILGADFRDRQIAINGWVNESEKDVFQFLNTYYKEGVNYCICTDISCDGMLSGPSFNIYRELTNITGLNVIASGGISSLSDLIELAKTGCEGAIIGKALYENKITLHELSLLC